MFAVDPRWYLGVSVPQVLFPIPSTIPRSRPLRPVFIGPSWEWLIGAEVCNFDFREDKILRRNRASRQPPQQGQLARVGHGVGERALQEVFSGDATEFRPVSQEAGQVGKNFVKVRNRFLKIVQLWRLVPPAGKVGAGVPQHAIHMTNKLQRRANFRRGTKRGELRRGATQRLLRSIGQCGQEVPQHLAFHVHQTAPSGLGIQALEVYRVFTNGSFGEVWYVSPP